MLALAQDDLLDAGPRRSVTERLCAATGVVKPITAMIRFVVGPEGAVVPDLKHRLPGRGVWVTATRAALQRAVARKAFARSFRREVRVSPDLVELTERLLEKAALDALAIVQKAGRLVLGFSKVEAALESERVIGLIHASDAAPDGVKKLDAALRRRFGDESKAVVTSFSSAQLNLVLGRSNVVHAALLAGPESDTFLARVARLDHFRMGGVDVLEGRKNRVENRDLNV